MKRQTQDNMTASLMIAAGIVLTLGAMLQGASGAKAQESEWEACIQKVSWEAYVEDDMEDTFDSGFVVGLLAAKICGVEK